MTWFKDLYGNLIGVTEIEATYAYGVITAIRNAGDFAAFGASKTYANVKYIDGTDNVVTVNSVTLRDVGAQPQKPVAGTYNVELMNIGTAAGGVLRLPTTPRRTRRLTRPERTSSTATCSASRPLPTARSTSLRWARTTLALRR